MKYQLQYNSEDLIDLEITDEPLATAYMKETVEFWADWEDDLKRAGGDYMAVFFRSLMLFFLNNKRLPCEDSHEDEGWYPLDGSHGIKATYWDVFEVDEDLISFTEA